MTLQTRLSRNYLSLALARFTAKVISFVAAVIIARHLGAGDFGIFTFSFAATTLAIVIFQGGLTPLVIREVARDRAAAPRYLSMSLLVRGGGALLVVGGAGAVYALTRSPAALAAAFAALALGFGTLLASFTDIFQGFERMEFVALVLVFNNVVTLGLVVVATLADATVFHFLALYAAANVLSLAFAALVCAAKFARPAGRVGGGELKRFVKAAIPFSLSALVASLYWRSDAVLLKALAGDRAVGIYGASARIVEGLVLVAGSFREAIYPVLSRFWPDSPDPFRDASRTAFKFLVALAVPIGVGTSIVAYKLFPFIYGADYAEGWIVLAVLIWALVAIFLRELTAATLFAFDLPKLVLASNALGAAASVAVNLVLIPYLSYLGPAIAGVVAAFVTTTFNMIVLGTRMRRLYPWSLALRPAAAAAVMAGVLALTWQWHVLANVALGAGVYAAALLLLRYYRPRQLLELLPRR
ncbi:MAG: flippase [Candidatus Coatesbacteria bacterium]|nr:MAG: flippase [Candidatus Coatesbacteria bacterium]